MFAATAAKLAELKAFRRRLFILCCKVIPAFAERALKHDIIAWHKSPFTLFMDLSDVFCQPSVVYLARVDNQDLQSFKG